ncbi:MAG: ribosomal protein S18-alanine N-acetyltransferase, partial [Oscillospiraceae bacterium]|nr:ribosomal protein S18-alanine N-acetyltransferase [Oscillospiraceae bacterium]
MNAAHIPQLVEIERASFSKPWTDEGFLSEIDNDTARFYAAKTGDRVVGYMGFYIVCGEGYVANIAVAPEYRRQGIAGRLIENALQICKNSGAEFLSLEVRTSNTAA